MELTLANAHKVKTNLTRLFEVEWMLRCLDEVETKKGAYLPIKHFEEDAEFLTLLYNKSKQVDNPEHPEYNDIVEIAYKAYKDSLLDFVSKHKKGEGND